MGNIIPFPGAPDGRNRPADPQVGFTRVELGRIIDLYGRMVAAGMSESGTVLRRGHELGPVLAPIERRLLKIVG